MITSSKHPFPEKFIGIALLVLSGPFIWVLHFAVVYGVQHMVCVVADKHADYLVKTSIIVITVAALLVLVVLIAKPDLIQRLDKRQVRPESTRLFFSSIMRLLAFLSFFGVLWSGMALFFMPACGSLT